MWCSKSDAAPGLLRFRRRAGRQLPELMKDNRDRPVVPIHFFRQLVNFTRQQSVAIKDAAEANKCLDNLDAGSNGAVGIQDGCQGDGSVFGKNTRQRPPPPTPRT